VAGAQSVRGLVVERDTNRTIELASVLMTDEAGDTIASALSDENGFFILEADDGGRYTLIAEALGYRAIVVERFDLEDNEDRVVEVTLDPRPVELQGLNVEAGEPELRGLAATGFYDRLAGGEGHYLLPGHILNSRERWTAQLFWEMDAEIARVREAGRGPWDNRVEIKNVSGMSLYCTPRVFVDGIWVQDPARMVRTNPDDPFHGDRVSDVPNQALSDLVPKDDLLAVEVYLEGSIPDRFLRAMQLNEAGDPLVCGVVLFWTVAYAG
jgi:carboxypeptidase family protein